MAAEATNGNGESGFTKSATLWLTVLGLMLSGILAFNTLIVQPLALRVDRLELALASAERDRSELLSRISSLEEQGRGVVRSLQRIEGKLFQ